MKDKDSTLRVVSKFSPPFNVAESISGVYGDQLWQSDWEPDQQESISRVLHDSTAVFIDVGAAVGVYTLMAAAMGKQVIAIEPGELIFQDLKSNIECNPSFAKNVNLLNGFAVAQNRTNRKLGGHAQKSGNMVFSKRDYVLAELLKQHQNLVIKMDIEGAEWAIVQDKQFIETLKEKDFILFLSLHIGFHDFAYENLRQKIVYRMGVLTEIFTLLRLSLKFKYFYELRNGNLKKVNFFRRNVFNGNAWHHYPIVISNSGVLIESLKTKSS